MPVTGGRTAVSPCSCTVKHMDGEDAQDSPAENAAPIRLSPDDLAPETLRAVVESFVLREGTDYGLRESSLDAKVQQVLGQLHRRQAFIIFDPPSVSVSIVVASAVDRFVP